MMERQLGHMVRLIDDLLDLSRIANGKMETPQGADRTWRRSCKTPSKPVVPSSTRWATNSRFRCRRSRSSWTPT